MYKVAVVQTHPRLLDLDYNLQQMVDITLTNTADLFVFPELATSGYVFASIEEIEDMCENACDGKSIVTMQNIAIERNCSIIYGFVEKDGNKYYNSSILLNPDGTKHIYRKIHLFNREKLFFSAGNVGFEVHEAKLGVKIGMMICFDWQFPEAARTLALKGAQIICHPANLVLPWCQEAMKTRSLENRVFSITSNRIGSEQNCEHREYFTGMSQILSTKGEVLARLSADKAGIAIVDIDPAIGSDKTVTERNNAFQDRRPEFYFNG